MNDEQNQYQDQANINLNLFNGNAEQWTIATDKAREANEKGIPVSVFDVLESDNNEIIGLSANGLHPRLQKTLAENPLRVTTYRDQLPQLDAFARAADWAEKSGEERAAAIREQYRAGGVPAAKQREMGVSGVRKVSGGKFEDGAGNNTDPVSYLDTCGPEERQMLEKALQSVEKAGGDIQNVKNFHRLTNEGQGMVLNALIARQKKANALLGLLHTEVGPEWQDMSDADKKRYIEAIGSSRGMDFSDVDLKMLEKGGFADVDYLEMTNILGIRDLYKLATAKTPEELAAVGDTSPLSDKFALLTHLRDQALEMRGLGAAAGTAQMIASSVPFMVELGLTGGMATVGKMPLRVAVSQALKAGGVEGLKGTATALFRKEGRQALGNAVKAIAAGEAKRTPAYIPKLVAQTANEFNEGPVVVPGEDGMQLVVPERKADELVTILLRNVISNYTERTTEWGGEFLPDVNILTRMMPKGVKNRIAQVVLNTTWDAADPAKRGLLRSAFLDDMPFSGDLTEFLEEKINTLAYYAMTRVAEATGVEALNMGQETPLGTWQENLQTLVSVMVQSNAVRGIRLTNQVQNVRDLTRLVDNHRVMRSAAENVPLEQRSTVQSREYYDIVRGGDRDYYISTEDALTYFQSDPEMAKACGITEESIREAEEKGLYVAVSENRMLAEEAKSPAAKEAGERLLAMVRQSGITIGEALKNDVGEEVVKLYQEQQERVQRYRKRFAEIFSAAEAAGVSQRAINGNAELIGRILNHIAAGMKNSESVEKALDGLITVMEQDPENFARNVQMGLRPEYLTEATEEVLTALEAVADAPIEAEEEAEVETTAAEPVAETPVKTAETPAVEPVAETPELTAEETAILEEIGEPVSANRTLELAASLTEEQAQQYQEQVTSLVNMYRKQFENAGADEGEMTIRAWAAVARVLPKAKGDPKNLIFTAIKNAIYTYMGEVQRKEAGKVSINKEIGDDGATLEDFVADTGMDQPYQSMEMDEASEEAKRAVRAILKAVNTPPANTSGEDAETAVKTRKMILRGLLSGQTQTAIAEAHGTSKQNVGQMVKRLQKILIRTTEKYDADKEEVLRYLLKAFKNEPDAFYQAEIVSKSEKLRHTTVASVESGVIHKTADKTAIEAAMEYVNNLPEHVFATEIGDIEFDAPSVSQSLSHTIYQNKLDAVQAVPDVLTKGVYLGEAKDKDGKPIMNFYFAGKVIIGGNEKIVFVRTRQSKGRSNRFYVHEVFTEDEITKLGSQQTDAASDIADRKYRNASEFYRNIVAMVLNVNPLKEENSGNLFQQGSVIYRGAAQFGTYFDQNYRAIITLFQGTADASTLVHESSHWLKRLMQSLCEMRDAEGNYIAEDSLREEFASIEKWLDGQKYDAAKGSLEYIVERDEKFARAFEYYVMKGGTPPAQVTSAFATLRNMLLAIYREIASFPEKFGFVFSDDIKSVFDRMMATDTVLERESQLREASAVLRETFAGLLGLSGEEMDNMQKVIKLADSQMVAELDRHQNKLLPAFRREWRKEAQEQMAEMREYQAWNACRKTDKADGRLDTDLLKSEPGISEDMVKLLHSRGLTVRNGANPADLMRKLDYASVQEMVQDLAKMQTPKEFTDNYLKEQEAAFRQNLTLDEKTMSVSGIRDLLDELHKVLSVRGGREGNAIRKGEAENAALKELGEKPVNWVESDKKFLDSLKEHSRDLTKAIAKKDYLLALEHLNAIRKLYAVLREKADAKKRIEKTRNKLRTVMRSKPKSGEKAKFYGDYYDALTELAFYFGFTKKQPKAVKPMEPNFRQQVLAEEAEDDMQDASGWEDYLLSNNEVSYGELTWEQFSRFADFVDYLYGRGRELVADERESFGAKVKAGKEAIVDGVSDQPAKYHRRKETAQDKIKSAGRSLLHVGNNLRYLLGKADKFRHMAKDGEIGPCLHIRELLVPGASEAVRLEVETMAKIRESMDALWEARERILMPANFRFTGEGLVYGYSRWTPEMVIKACLNLGNPVNRDRLVRGFGWEENDLNELATCIPADLWPHIQKIWDALGGDLQKAAARTFLAENFYKMPLVKAEGMSVRYPDGTVVPVEGGYFPIQYAHHEKSKSKPIPQSHTRGLYAEVSSTMLRKDDLQKVNPLNLSMNGVVKHIHETAWYAATRMACREAISIFRSSEVEMAFGSTQGFEAYDQVLNLLRNFANPDALTEGMGGDGGFMDMFERWGKTVMTSGALMANLSSIMKQPASLTVGANETGQYMLDALAAYSKNPVNMTAKVKALSAMMRERVNYMDPDLREDIGKFGISKAERGRRTMMRIGYAAMRYMDGMVAVPVWYSKYQQVMDRLMKSEDAVLEEASKQAVAEADDFVARTQGAGRLLDLTPVQLDRVGRLLSPFMTAANAQFNTTLETMGAVRHGVLSPGQALMALTMNLFAPALYSGAVVAALNGAMSDDDDDIDRSLKAALVELLTTPFSGFPLVRDVGQHIAGTAVDAAVGGKKSYRPLMFSAAPFEAASRIFESVTASGEALSEGNFSRAAWKAADAVGDIYSVPAIRIYERAVRQYKRSGGELPELLETLEKSTKKGRK